MTPRWLLNENFPQPSVRHLRSLGWDVAAIGEDSPSIQDEVVMARARAEGRWLVTFDRDYGELVFKRGLSAPPLILLLRVTRYQPEDPADWLLQLHTAQEFREGSFHIFDGQTIRRRPFLAGLPGGRA
jgi:predicted nuclease of predicted toxin-antitoxin system